MLAQNTSRYYFLLQTLHAAHPSIATRWNSECWPAFQILILWSSNTAKKTCFKGLLECRPGDILSFSVSLQQSTVLPYKMHILGKKRHAKFSPASVFSSIRIPKSSKQKNNPVWSTYATKIAIHCIFTGFCERSASKTPQDRFPFSFKIVSYFLPPLKMENSKKQGQKVPGKK